LGYLKVYPILEWLGDKMKEYFSKDYIVEDAPILYHICFDLYLTKKKEVGKKGSLLRIGMGR